MFECKLCHKPFIPKDNNKSHIKRSSPKYCSNVCKYKSRKGMKFTEEHKDKLRQNKLKNPTRYWLGKKRSEKTKLAISKANTGRKMSEETKRKLSIALKGRVITKEAREKLRKAHLGEKGSNWKGGISKEYKRIRAGLYFKEWREAVFERDNYTCKKCKIRSGNGRTIVLHPHHIINFYDNKEDRFNINNGITLCLGCHKLFHKKYGFKNNGQEQINEFIK